MSFVKTISVKNWDNTQFNNTCTIKISDDFSILKDYNLDIIISKSIATFIASTNDNDIASYVSHSFNEKDIPKCVKQLYENLKQKLEENLVTSIKQTEGENANDKDSKNK